MPPRVVSACFAIAMAAGLLHGAASFYWALGGEWLLATVGQFAVEMRREGGAHVQLMLGLVAAAKAAAAVIPWADQRSAPMHRWVRIMSCFGALALLVWGGAGMAGAWVSLLIGRSGWTHPAVVGHALLWDPLFVLWGAALSGGLWLSRARR